MFLFCKSAPKPDTLNLVPPCSHLASLLAPSCLNPKVQTPVLRTTAKSSPERSKEGRAGAKKVGREGGKTTEAETLDLVMIRARPRVEGPLQIFQPHRKQIQLRINGNPHMYGWLTGFSTGFFLGSGRSKLLCQVVVSCWFWVQG